MSQRPTKPPTKSAKPQPIRREEPEEPEPDEAPTRPGRAPSEPPTRPAVRASATPKLVKGMPPIPAAPVVTRKPQPPASPSRMMAAAKLLKAPPSRKNTIEVQLDWLEVDDDEAPTRARIAPPELPESEKAKLDRASRPPRKR